MEPFSLYPREIQMQLTIGICGRARHGKGTLANLMWQWFEKRGQTAQVISFADPLKQFLIDFIGRKEPFRGNDEQRNAPVTEITWADLTPAFVEAARVSFPDLQLESHPTGRQLMQLFGTEVIRTNFCANAWVRIAGGRAKQFNGVTIVDDVRFPNEAYLRHDGPVMFGIFDAIYKIVRPGMPVLTHPSETEVDKIPLESFERVFENDGDIWQLNLYVDSALRLAEYARDIRAIKGMAS